MAVSGDIRTAIRGMTGGHALPHRLMRTLNFPHITERTSQRGTQMELKTVGEIMIPLEQYPAIKDTSTLKEAIETIQRYQIKCGQGVSMPRVLLVFDELSLLVGTLRRRDILRGLEPQFLLSETLDYRKKLFDIKTDPHLSELSSHGQDMVEEIRQQAERKVYEVMMPLKLWVDYNDHVMKAIYEMVDNNVSILPVVRDEDVVGVVRSVEVFTEAARLVLGE
jgi:CBS domain-containing protein